MGLFDRIRARYGQDPRDGNALAPKRSPLETDLIDRLRTMLPDAAEAADPIRLHLRFSGTVQGVGFRWTNQDLARGRGLTGWVRNLPDGTVEMEIQGTPAQLIMHLDALHAQYLRFGNDVWLDEQRRLPARDDERDFSVRF